MISNQCSYELYPNILYTTGPHIEHQQYSDSDNPTYEYCIYLRIESVHNTKKNDSEKDVLNHFYIIHSGMERIVQSCKPTLEQIHEELSSPGPATIMLRALLCNSWLKYCETTNRLQMPSSRIFQFLLSKPIFSSKTAFYLNTIPLH